MWLRFKVHPDNLIVLPFFLFPSKDRSLETMRYSVCGSTRLP